MEVNLISKSLENYLLKKLNKEYLESDDLDRIEEISINAFNENKSIEDYNFKDFEKFKNLKYLSLRNFNINNFETNEINRCKNIIGLQFSKCVIKSKSRLQSNIKIISFDNCKKVKLYYISLLKELQILKLTNLKRVNLSNINGFKNLEKLYLENERIINIKKILFLKSIVYLQIKNCKWNKNYKQELSKFVSIDIPK